MAQVLSMGKRSSNFVVARRQSEQPQYLTQFGTGFAWDADIRRAIQFPNEEKANIIAARISGGAVVAEMVEA